jgi:anaerobic selenocysteine-containing dehydrogenase
MPKSADFRHGSRDPLAVFREASWDEALELAGGTLAKIRDAHGGDALAGFGSAKGSNEEAYLFQSSCAPASARTTSTTARGFAMRRAWRAARGHRLGRRLEPGDGRAEG